LTKNNSEGKNAPQSEDYDTEWKSCLESTTKFDGYLVDLRKYGFSLLTGLTAGSSFLGFASPSQILQIGVIIVTMILVVVLYWVDVYYQNLLYGSVLRSRFLELFRLNRGLSNYISALAGTSTLHNTLYLLYGGFIIGLGVLGMIVIFNAHCNDIISSGSISNKNVTTSGERGTTTSASATSNKSTDPNKCFGESFFRVPIVTLLLGGTSVVTVGAVLRIYFVHEKERMCRVESIRNEFYQGYESFKTLTDNNAKKAQADRLEKKIMSEFFMTKNSHQKKKDIQN
jgi:hypothetical protein